MVADARFSELLKAEQDRANQADVSSTWMPPDGTYQAIVTEVKSGVAKDAQSGTEYLWWRPEAQIVGSDQDGKSFSLGFLSTRSDVNFNMLLAFARDCCGGEVTRDLTIVNEVLTQLLPGAEVVVEVLTKTANNGRDYTNARIKRAELTKGDAPSE